MLPEAVIADFLRHCPTQQALVELAWPSLAVGEQLQLINAFQYRSNREDHLGHTPDFLLDLALNSDSPIVRYWAARGNYLTEHTSRPEDRVRFEKIKADPEALVRYLSAPLAGYMSYGFQNLNTDSSLQRCIALRNLEKPDIEGFIKWLASVHTTLPETELIDAVFEFFANPVVVALIKRGAYSEYPGMGEHMHALSAGHGMLNGWDLAKRASPMVAEWLASYLPTSLGTKTMEAQAFVDMPRELLKKLVGRAEGKNVFAELLAFICQHPDRFPEDLNAYAKKHVEDIRGLPPYQSAEESDAAQRSEEFDKKEQLVNAVDELRLQIEGLADAVRQGFAVEPRRRGLFG